MLDAGKVRNGKKPFQNSFITAFNNASTFAEVFEIIHQSAKIT